MWIVLLILVVVLLVALAGGMAYRGRGVGPGSGAGAAATPQTTIVETGRPTETRRTESTTVTRETETIEE
jgi:flagellar basal body-associated protein FliL